MMDEIEYIIPAERSISIAAHVATLGALDRLVKYTHDIEGVSSYTLGSLTGLDRLTDGVDIIRSHDPEKRIVYEHQRADTDLEWLAKPFVNKVKQAGADAVVLFPSEQFDPLAHWVEAAQTEGLGVIIGTDSSRFRKVGESTIKIVLRHSANLGVNNIWVRGNDARLVHLHQQELQQTVKNNYDLWIPRRVDKYGKIGPLQDNGERRHYVVGRAICKAADPRMETVRLSEELLGSTS